MRVLFDFEHLGPAAGGVNTVYHYLGTQLLKHVESNDYYAMCPGKMSQPFVKLHNPLQAGDSMREKLRSMSCNVCEPVVGEDDGLSLRRIYHGKYMKPARSIWRAAVAGVRRTEVYRDGMREMIFAQRCKQNKIDVIHCPHQRIRPRPPRHLKGIPYIMNLHDLQHEHFPQFFSMEQLRFRRTIWYESARACRFVVVAAEHVQEDVVKYIGLPRERVPVIQWGPPGEGLNEPSVDRKEHVKKAYCLPEAFVVYPAIAWEHKNHIRLLQCVCDLKQSGVNVNLVLPGVKDGPYADRVKFFVLHNNLTKNVKPLHAIPYEDLFAIYHFAVGVIVPSLHEQSSGPLAEAMLCGVPVAASDIADHQELLGHGCGLLFNPSRPDEIARALKCLWERGGEATLMAEKAKARVKRIRNWEKCSKAYGELYEQCLSGGACEY